MKAEFESVKDSTSLWVHSGPVPAKISSPEESCGVGPLSGGDLPQGRNVAFWDEAAFIS